MNYKMLHLCVTLLLALSFAPSWGECFVADADFLMKEKSILQLLVHVSQPLMYPNLMEMAATYKIEDNIDMYKDKSAVREFLIKWEKKEFLKKGEIFTALDDDHTKQAIKLFDLMYFAKDWDTFFKTAVWTRENMNEGMFVYALTIALRHREDTRHLVLPPLYEIMPHMYIRSDALHKAYEARMKSVNKVDKDIIVIYSNMSEWMHSFMSPEMRMATLTEDITVNQGHMEFHMESPWWLTKEKYDFKFQRHGERVYYGQKQLLAKYYLDRLTNDLDDFEKFKWDNEKMIGFAPHMHYKNGHEMPARPDDIWLKDTKDLTIDAVKDMERRIMSAIETGYLVNKEGKVINLETKDAVESIGRLINGNMEGVNPKAYGALWKKMMSLVGQVTDPEKKWSMAPSALMHWETQLRDPIFFSILKRVHKIFGKHKDMLPPYEKSQLLVPGVKIDTFDVDKLVTFFEPFDVEINNAIDVRSLDEDKSMSVIVRHSYINHLPWSYRLNVNSEKPMSVILRLFMGPKTDANGIELNLKEKAHLMVELDRATIDLKAGKNMIERNSEIFKFFKKQKDGMKKLFKKVEDAIQGKSPFLVDEDAYKHGYPAHHVLPKGKKFGMPYTLFVVVSPMKESATIRQDPMMDELPMGYPFDRKIDMDEFMVPNMMEKDVIIYHKKTEEKFESF